MICVDKSSSGQWILTHVESESVATGSDFTATYAKLLAHLRDQHIEMATEAVEVAGAVASTGPRATAGASNSSRAVAWRRALLAVLAALPFVWLALMYVSMSGLVSDLRVQLETETHGSSETKVAAELEALRTQVAELARLKPEPNAEEPLHRRRREGKGRGKQKRKSESTPISDDEPAAPREDDRKKLGTDKKRNTQGSTGPKGDDPLN